MLNIGQLVEINSGPYMGERARVTHIDPDPVFPWVTVRFIDHPTRGRFRSHRLDPVRD